MTTTCFHSRCPLTFLSEKFLASNVSFFLTPPSFFQRTAQNDPFFYLAPSIRLFLFSRFGPLALTLLLFLFFLYVFIVQWMMITKCPLRGSHLSAPGTIFLLLFFLANPLSFFSMFLLCGREDLLCPTPPSPLDYFRLFSWSSRKTELIPAALPFLPEVFEGLVPPPTKQGPFVSCGR